MQQRQTAHVIIFNPKQKKKQIIDLIQFSGITNKKYVIVEFWQKHEHHVFRLLSYFCQYNPTELA